MITQPCPHCGNPNTDLQGLELESGYIYLCPKCEKEHVGPKPSKSMYLLEELNSLSARVHGNAIQKGWWKDRDTLMRAAEEAGISEFGVKAVKSQMIALEHSELSEGLEGIRKDLRDDHIPEFTMEEAEAADVIIRIMDRGAAFNLRIWEAVFAKMAYNEGRPYLHGGKAF